MNIVLVDDDIEFSNKLKVDVKLYFKQLDENINFIVLNDSFDTIKDIDQIDLIFLDVDLNFEMNGIDIGAYLKSKFPKIIIVFVSMHEDFVFPALSIGFFQFIRKTKYDFDIVKVLKQIEDYLKENGKLAWHREQTCYTIMESKLSTTMKEVYEKQIRSAA